MKVAIVGGTHGNEKTGVFLAKKWLKNIETLPSEHSYKICLGNLEAIEKNQRFIDHDLNRSFNSKTLQNSDSEFERSHALKTEILSWAGDDPFFLIDLHTTTSNLKNTLVLSKSDLLSAHVIRHTLEKIPDGNLLFNSGMDQNCVFVDTIAPHGVLVEVGPVPQNTYNHDIISATEKVVLTLLNCLSEVEKRSHLEPVSLSGYKEVDQYLFPLDKEGEIESIIHPQLLGKDYHPLNPGDPLFINPIGETLYYEGSEVIYPVFISEAAYLQTNMAFRVAKKMTMEFK